MVEIKFTYLKNELSQFSKAIFEKMFLNIVYRVLLLYPKTNNFGLVVFISLSNGCLALCANYRTRFKKWQT